MTTHGLRRFQSELLHCERVEQAKFELGSIAFISAVIYATTWFSKKKGNFSASELLVASLSSFVANHLIDAATRPVFAGSYKKGVLRAGLISGMTAFASQGSLAIFRRVVVGTTNESINTVTLINGIIFNITFNKSRSD